MSTSSCWLPTIRTLGMALVIGLIPGLVRAEPTQPQEGRWLLVTRVVLSGSSDSSDPEGISILSGLGIEAAVRRSLERRLAVELSLRTESREVDRDIEPVGMEALGSLEVLPLSLTLQYHPDLRGRFHPYVGAGINLTTVWEKSGALDTYDVEPHVGPALQLGLDTALGSLAAVNLDVRWNTLAARIVRDGVEFAEVKVDPIAIGLGVGLRF